LLVAASAGLCPQPSQGRNTPSHPANGGVCLGMLCISLFYFCFKPGGSSTLKKETKNELRAERRQMATCDAGKFRKHQ
jgi:amino acid transporter